MKYFLLFIASFLFSSEYYAKILPYDEFVISAKVSGLVTYVNKNIISFVANDESIVKIDDEIAKINLEVTKATYEIKKRYYEKIKNLSTKSKNEKDNEKIIYLNAKQAYIKAKDEFTNKNIKAKGLYVYDILVNKGTYVNISTPLIKAYDVSKAKIYIFLSKDELKNINKKKILVNGKDNFKINKIFNIDDGLHVSSFKVELVGISDEFSTIAKVQIQ